MTTDNFEVRDFAKPDQVLGDGSHGRLEMIRIAGHDVGRVVLEPGWNFTEDVKPFVGTDLCEVVHFGYQISGTVRFRMADGAEFDVTPGQVMSVPAGHDAWVVGDETAVAVDWGGWQSANT